MDVRQFCQMIKSSCWRNPELDVYDLMIRYGSSVAVTNNDEMLMPRQCFTNASRCALLPQYEYVEGFVQPPGIPIPISHAWIYDRVLQVYLDPTIKDAENHTYYGLRFPTEMMMEIMVDSQLYKGNLLETCCRGSLTVDKQRQYREAIVALNTPTPTREDGVYRSTRGELQRRLRSSTTMDS